MHTLDNTRLEVREKPVMTLEEALRRRQRMEPSRVSSMQAGSLLILVAGRSYTIVGVKSQSAEQLSRIAEQIPRDRSIARMSFCTPETSLGVNILLEESQLSVRHECEVVNQLTLSTSDGRSSGLRVEEPKLRYATPLH